MPDASKMIKIISCFEDNKYQSQSNENILNALLQL